MIKNTEQAIEVQDRRLSSGKKGISKAVRRFHKRTACGQYQGAQLNMSLDADFSGCRTFDEVHT